MLQSALEPSIGPLLTVVGLAIRGLPGAFLLGIMFAVTSSPTSAALFFGSLLPLALTAPTRLPLFVIHALATALPVAVVALAILFEAQAGAKPVGGLQRWQGSLQTANAWFDSGAGPFVDAVVTSKYHETMKQQDVITALAALAQDSRLAIYRLLVKRGPEGYAAGEIGDRLKIAGPSLSFHLKELAHAGLVTARKDGRFIYYSAHFERMNDLVGYLTENCCSQGAVCAPVCAPNSPIERKRKSA